MVRFPNNTKWLFSAFAHPFARNGQLSFLIQRKGENDPRKFSDVHQRMDDFLTYPVYFLGLLHCVKKQDIIRLFVFVMETLLQKCTEESKKVWK